MPRRLKDETHLHATAPHRHRDNVADQRLGFTGERAKVQDDRNLSKTELHALYQVKPFSAPAGGSIEQPGDAIDRDIAFPRCMGECGAVCEKVGDGLSQHALDLAGGPFVSILDMLDLVIRCLET